MIEASNYIGVGAATLYSESNPHSEWISQLGYGTKVEITKVEKDWTLVKSPDGTGWIESRSIIKASSPLPEGIEGRITSIWAFVFLKDDPAKKPYPGLKLPYGTYVRVPTPITKFRYPGATGDFIVVSLVDGKKGAVRQSAIDTSGKFLSLYNAMIESGVLSTLPYVWGGTSALDGLDCSGFVQTIFKQTGISLPRNAKDQLEFGVAVSKTEITTGDLLFFKNKTDQYHVGIYINDGCFSHFSGETGFTQSDLGSEEWSQKFIGARRIRK